MSWYYCKLLYYSCRVDQKCHFSFSSPPGYLHWIKSLMMSHAEAALYPGRLPEAWSF